MKHRKIGMYDKRTAAGRKLSRCRYFEVTDTADGYVGHRCANLCTTGTYYHMCSLHAHPEYAQRIRALRAKLPATWIARFYEATAAQVAFDAQGTPYAMVDDPNALHAPPPTQTPAAPTPAPVAPQAAGDPVDRFTAAARAWREAAERIRFKA